LPCASEHLGQLDIWANIAHTNVHGLDAVKLEDGNPPTSNSQRGYPNLHDTRTS
jgi:hypothetical protein